MRKIEHTVGISFFLVILMFVAFSASGGDRYDNRLVVQQIGDVTGEAADAIFEEVKVVPFSRRIDAKKTPILLGRGTAYLLEPRKNPSGRKRVRGLTRAEKKGLRRAYRAGQTIVILDASTHDVEALHALLRDGAAHESKTDPVVLAYALRQVDELASARVVTRPRPAGKVSGDPGADALAWNRSIEIILDELTSPPLSFPEPVSTGLTADWGSSPVQSTVVTSTTNGIYNTPMQVFALHECSTQKDYYLVNTGGDWTATDAKFQSASAKAGSLSDPSNGSSPSDLVIDWDDSSEYCTGGIAVANGLFGGDDQRICRYVSYPTSYEVDIVPPNGPTIVQIDASPAATQGLSSTSTTGFTWSLGGSVNISGKGASAGLNAGVSWSNSNSVTVPPLLTSAGDTGNEGAFTRYEYCTDGKNPSDCTNTIQMTGASGACRSFQLDDPQKGQGPSGRMSGIAQTVNWRVDPTTYVGTTFDVAVTWKVNLAVSESRLWWGKFGPTVGDNNNGPSGNCNVTGCSCSISNSSSQLEVSHTFKVPFPSTTCLQ